MPLHVSANRRRQCSPQAERAGGNCLCLARNDRQDDIHGRTSRLIQHGTRPGLLITPRARQLRST